MILQFLFRAVKAFPSWHFFCLFQGPRTGAGGLCELRWGGGVQLGGAELPPLAAATPQHSGAAVPAFGGAHEIRGIYAKSPSAYALEQNV